MEKEVNENNKKDPTVKGKVEKDVSKPMKSTASTTCSSKVFSIDNVMKDPFETPLLKQQMKQKLPLNQIHQIWKSIS